MPSSHISFQKTSMAPALQNMKKSVCDNVLISVTYYENTQSQCGMMCLIRT